MNDYFTNLERRGYCRAIEPRAEPRQTTPRASTRKGLQVINCREQSGTVANVAQQSPPRRPTLRVIPGGRR
jgi:hypothetical protein